MTKAILIFITLSAIFLVVYHHAIYPIILSLLSRKRLTKAVQFDARHYDDKNNGSLPSITIVIPAYNEAEWIAEKINNLAFLDYPSNLYRVILACDGCSDNTAQIARECLAQAECSNLNMEIREFTRNRGKVAVLNEVLQSVETELVALTDVSALISVDALSIAAAHFRDPSIGVLNSRYKLLNPGSEGEAKYWNYQTRVKSCEAALGATLGAHGAFYMFRRELHESLAEDTINDDFILPMTIVSKGYRAQQDNRINAIELEQASDEEDRKRRMRISAGNLQQLLRLKHLLLPKYGGVAFAFASGKALRVLMPFFMITAYFGSLSLTDTHYFFSLSAVGQTLIYVLAMLCLKTRLVEARGIIKTITYIVSGHLSGLLGTLHYLSRRHHSPWRRVTANNNEYLGNGHEKVY